MKMKIVVCKKNVDIIDVRFIKNLSYFGYEDKNKDSILILNSSLPGGSSRFYYEGYYRYSSLSFKRQVLIYEDYFYSLKEIRKQKLYKINEKSIV